jgi:excisionase family DNA binding protein
MIQDELISIGDAARQLGVSVETIRRWEHEGKIAGTRTLGNQRRFTKAEVARVANGTAA